MTDIIFLDRITKKEETEKVYNRHFIRLLYGEGLGSYILSFFLLPLVAKIPFLSRWYGAIQRHRSSKSKIAPFIETFQVDPSEFLESVQSYQSFNDFFIRKLKPEARPIANGNDVAILPADGRYLVYPNLSLCDGFVVKGQKFDLASLLQDEKLARQYHHGSMVIARLCPSDYHRFHFPCSCIPEKAIPIKGNLFSVNPWAIRKNIHIFSENKREITKLHAKHFGKILYIEIGATCVGTIHQTYVPEEPYAKGDEKGYFSFGGSSLILLFEPNRIQFDQDLVEASQQKMEMRGLMGQSLGRALSPLGFDI